MTGSAALPPDVRALFDGLTYARAWMQAFG
jgi:hypothetical protein